MKWIDYKKQKPTEGIEVIAYHHKWVDQDFNPKGIRIGFLQEPSNFISAHWWNDQDSYITISNDICNQDENTRQFYKNLIDSTEPEYWTELPQFNKFTITDTIILLILNIILVIALIYAIIA